LRNLCAVWTCGKSSIATLCNSSANTWDCGGDFVLSDLASTATIESAVSSARDLNVFVGFITVNLVFRLVTCCSSAVEADLVSFPRRRPQVWSTSDPYSAIL